MFEPGRGGARAQVLMGLQELHTFRLQAGSMVLRPPLVAGGLPSWRGASGEHAPPPPPPHARCEACLMGVTC